MTAEMARRWRKTLWSSDIVVGSADLPEANHALRGRGRELVEVREGRFDRVARRAAAARPRHDDRLHGGPAVIRGLAENEDRIGPIARHQAVRGLDRYAAQHRNRSDRFLEVLVVGELDQL